MNVVKSTLSDSLVRHIGLEKTVDKEEETRLPVVVGVEQKLNVVVPPDIRVSPHVVRYQLVVLRHKALEGEVDALIVVDDLGNRTLRTWHPVVGIPLYKSIHGDCVLPRRIIQTAVYPRAFGDG